MYLQINNNPDSPVLMSRKLFKAMNFPKGHPMFLQIVQVKGESSFAIVKRTPKETFQTQCCMILPTGKKRTPASFEMTIPSMEYFLAVTGIQLMTSKILKVKEIITPQITYYRICNK